MQRFIASFAATLVLAICAPARAEIRAVLVAVSEYTAPIPSLEGPPNDAAALRTVLEAQGAKDIVTLRDGQATRANIRGALEAIGKRSKPGDWVIFFYAGHGAQAKARDATEADGMDEFLALGGFQVSTPDPNQFILDNDLRADESLLTGESVPVRKVVWNGSAQLGRAGGGRNRMAATDARPRTGQAARAGVRVP